MKITTLAVAAGVSAPLILSGSASGGFQGVATCVKLPAPSGFLTVNVYAVFDRPGEDHMLAVAGTPNSPLYIEVVGGTFYQHQFGTDRPPLDFFVEAFPSLAFDTFVTIGVKCVGDLPGCQPQDNMVITPGWPGFGSSVVSTSNSGWATNPSNPQGNPFDPVNSFPGDGRILIGQFSTADGNGISGTIWLQFLSNGVVGQSVVSFFNGGANVCGACRSSEECNDGDPCDGREVCVDFFCQPSPPEPDCNKNGVLDSCDIANGTSADANGNGIPDTCECPWDLDGGGTVGITDFLALLAAWGPNPGHPADFDGDGTVGIVDFLALLANWGPCP